jgi:DNA modification methylase
MNKVLKGDALEVLQTLPTESVNCAVTSPPYWGLRDYGTKPIIWDGDADCEHEWGKARKIPATTQWNTGGVFDPQNRKVVQEEKYIGQSCKKCGAWKGSLGLEPTFELYIKHLCDIFDETKRVLRNDGTCWVNLGDTYNGNKSGNTNGIYKDKIDKTKSWANSDSFNKTEQNLPSKSLCLIPFRFAIEMVNRGWILRNVIIWHKPNCMPSSAKDRFTVDFEYLFFFVKNKKYWFEQQFEPHLSPVTNKIVGRKGTDVQQSQGDPNGFHAYGEQGRNKRTVWTIPTKPYPEAHFAVYPAELIRTCIKAGCPKGGVVLDPFAGSGTTLEEAIRQGKDYIGIELKDDYIDLIEKRLSKVQVSLI